MRFWLIFMLLLSSSGIACAGPTRVVRAYCAQATVAAITEAIAPKLDDHLHWTTVVRAVDAQVEATLQSKKCNGHITIKQNSAPIQRCTRSAVREALVAFQDDGVAQYGMSVEPVGGRGVTLAVPFDSSKNCWPVNANGFPHSWVAQCGAVLLREMNRAGSSGGIYSQEFDRLTCNAAPKAQGKRCDAWWKASSEYWAGHGKPERLDIAGGGRRRGEG